MGDLRLFMTGGRPRALLLVRSVVPAVTPDCNSRESQARRSPQAVRNGRSHFSLSTLAIVPGIGRGAGMRS